MKREYLFCDEVYSYGLANSNEYTFLHPGTGAGENNVPLSEWVSGTYFTDYINYQDESLSYKAAYVNQERDVHPPLYYMLLHTVCSFFPDAGYSAVPGLVLNLILLIFVDVFLLYVAVNLLGDRRYGLISMVLWALSSVGISNCMLIRMYMLQTLNVLAFTAVHIYVLRHKRKMTVPYFLMLALTVMIGGLTHYYFYFYVAGLGLCICICLLCMKQVKEMFVYGFSLVAGLVSAIAVFPATLSHIFGYRGSYATSNLAGFSLNKIVTYIKYVNRAYYAELLPVLLPLLVIFIAIFVILKFVEIHIVFTHDGNIPGCRVTTKKREIDGELVIEDIGRQFLFISVLVADAMLAFVGIQGSELVSARYIYSALPILAIFTVWCMKMLIPVITKKRAAVVSAVICILLCAGSLKVNGVDWQYETYASEQKSKVESMAGGDCLIVCHADGKWNNIYAGINVFSVMDRCRYVYEDEVSNAAEYTADCGDELYVAFITDPKFTSAEKKRMLKKILKTTKYNTHELKYNYSGICIYELSVKEKSE